jgi:hypothetical protein
MVDAALKPSARSTSRSSFDEPVQRRGRGHQRPLAAGTVRLLDVFVPGRDGTVTLARSPTSTATGSRTSWPCRATSGLIGEDDATSVIREILTTTRS